MMVNVMRHILCWVSAVLLVSLSAHAVAGQGDEMPPVLENQIFDLPQSTHRYTFRELGGDQPLLIDGMSNRLTLGFGSRMDQLVQGGTLYLNYTYSPTLLEDISQFRVRLNGELIRAVQLTSDGASERQQIRMELPAEYFDLYNELEFELLAEARGMQCSVVAPQAWLEFLGDSRLELTRQHLVVANDLSWFPEPFVDQRDFSRVNLHYLVPDQLSTHHVAAAGILSSYFGNIANWRGLQTHVYRYPEHQEDIHEVRAWPEHHAIVLMTNEQRPWLFRDLPAITTPTIRMVTNPVNQAYKMLLVQAPDAAGLIKAVQGLVENPVGMSGPELRVNQVRVERRAPYSAPRWISTQRPVRLAELVEFQSELQRSGYAGEPIGMNLRLPPDLFTWQRQGIPMDLRFRYTPPVAADESRMSVFVNDEFIKGYTLTERGFGGDHQRLRVPLLASNPFVESTIQIPAFKLGAVNRLDFRFSFSAVSEECRTRPLGNTVAAIDGDSQIDLRGYQHYTEMPNLHLFVKTGYPFSRQDDLANTILVIESSPSDTEFNATMTALGLIGASTGHHGSLLSVSTVAELPQRTEKDLLIVGGGALREFLERFGRDSLDRQLRHHGLAGSQSLLFSPQEDIQISGPSAALVSFESPLARQATVVALTANQDEFLSQVDALLRSPERNTAVRGFMSVLTPGSERHLRTYETYYVGELRLWTRLHFHLARYPVVVSVITLLALITLVLVLYWFLAGIARRRSERRRS
ncbi:cellulose biosynthesis cyclic di-GMP-binding regulatory protein BcsB [Aliidiomarina sanyensis]|uniref:Cyclic di-GMP-binding protein n=1 Tax=Aliidiomarina sanyensis TaxID=1249555 RepID=A0A432WPS4_9GAMM|nr:cellulose biosynthesis cyclic di-GMP-binding regulatory protein BcsB [Aliidiomarina sanyensis]RUO35775.1 hypothetical protein CWE11_03180 [Aliidiomarina sanyensis]